MTSNLTSYFTRRFHEETTNEIFLVFKRTLFLLSSLFVTILLGGQAAMVAAYRVDASTTNHTIYVASAGNVSIV